MSNERVTAKDILATVVSEAMGRPRAEVAAILDFLPLPRLDREYTAEEAERWLAGMRGELPLIRAWLRDGAARFEARLAAARREAIQNN
jgi:hypothetical protein